MCEPEDFDACLLYAGTNSRPQRGLRSPPNGVRILAGTNIVAHAVRTLRDSGHDIVYAAERKDHHIDAPATVWALSASDDRTSSAQNRRGIWRVSIAAPIIMMPAVANTDGRANNVSSTALTIGGPSCATSR